MSHDSHVIRLLIVILLGDVVPDQLTSSALSSMPGGDLRDGIGNIEGEIPSFSLEASSLPDFDLVSVAPVHEQNSMYVQCSVLCNL